jgi:hypothetical protein
MGIIVNGNFYLKGFEILFNSGLREEVNAIEKEGSHTDEGEVNGRGAYVSPLDVKEVRLQPIVVEVLEHSFSEDSFLLLLAAAHVLFHPFIEVLPFLLLERVIILCLSFLPVPATLPFPHALSANLIIILRLKRELYIVFFRTGKSSSKTGEDHLGNCSKAKREDW